MTKKSQEHNDRLAADRVAFSDCVTDIIAKTRRGELNRADRIKEMDALITAYIEGTGERPQPEHLTRLSDALLHEELTDPDPDKVANTEYPFLSETQFEERYRKEVPLHAVDETGTDGKSYRLPKKRKRTWSEEWKTDEESRATNRRRNAQYKRDTSNGPVTVGATASFADCRHILDRFAVTPSYYR